jgi:hypothetical protein
MFPNADTLFGLNRLEEQAQPREASRDRTGACAAVDRLAPPTRSRSACLAAASWCNDVVTRMHVAKREHRSPRLMSSSA